MSTPRDGHGERLIHHGRADLLCVSLFLGSSDARHEVDGAHVQLTETGPGRYELQPPFGCVPAEAEQLRVTLPDGRRFEGAIQSRRLDVLVFVGAEVT